jgi:DNA processing protein
MNDEELKYLIALCQIPQIGSITARKLIAYTGSAEAVFRESSKNLQKIPGVGSNLAKQKDSPGLLKIAEEEIEFINRNNLGVLSYMDPGYPERLRQCADSPLLIYFRGEDHFNPRYSISIVGTRRPSAYGIELCHKIINALAEDLPELVVVSGLAYGIDYQSHVAALKCGLKTVAVLAHGLHTLYPSSHHRVAQKIIENGTLITDFMSIHNPERNNFIKRNRIIAGFSDATLVIESDISGGALITADIAGSYNRDVFALPGRANDQMSSGCNRYIKANKAALVESAADIMFYLGWDKSDNRRDSQQRTLFYELSSEESVLIKAFGEDEKLAIDILSVRSNFPVSKVSAILLNLEFNGIVKVLPGNYYKIIK